MKLLQISIYILLCAGIGILSAPLSHGLLARLAINVALDIPLLALMLISERVSK